jgi:hypothetical protein
MYIRYLLVEAGRVLVALLPIPGAGRGLGSFLKCPPTAIQYNRLLYEYKITGRNNRDGTMGNFKDHVVYCNVTFALHFSKHGQNTTCFFSFLVFLLSLWQETFL